jgi:hypothetical protein
VTAEGHSVTATDDILQRAAVYRHLVINKDNANWAMAQRFERRHRVLGVPVILTTTAVSTAIFGTLEAQTALGWRVATGLVSLAAAVLAALQTFFDYSGLAQQHQVSAKGYSKLRRQLELFELRHCSEPTSRDAALQELNDLVQQLDELEAHEAAVSDVVYERIQRRHGDGANPKP